MLQLYTLGQVPKWGCEALREVDSKRGPLKPKGSATRIRLGGYVFATRPKFEEGGV